MKKRSRQVPSLRKQHPNVLVSVIIPIYNVERFLEKCLKSVISQTLKGIEIIAVNDGSTDNSVRILKNISTTTSIIKIINQDNQGLSVARNTGIKAAKGEFLSFIDSDDTISPTMLEKMYNKAVNENSDIVWCRYQQVDHRGSVLYVSGSIPDSSRGEMFKRILSSKVSTMACNKIFRRELFIENKILFPIGLYHEDIATIYKLFYFAKSYSGIDDICYFWLRRDNSISKTLTQKHIDDLFTNIRLTKEFLIQENIFEKFEIYYLRRSFHFLLGIMDRVHNFKNHSLNSINVITDVFDKLKAEGLVEKNTLIKLSEYDINLYRKFQMWEDFLDRLDTTESPSDTLKMLRLKEIEVISLTQELFDIKNSVEYKIFDKTRRFRGVLFPEGSRRKEFVRSFFIEKKGVKNTVNKDLLKKEKQTPMLDVAMKILKEEEKGLKRLKNKFKGERCFIVGNGPSLNKCDLSLLKDEYSFAVNGIFYKTEEMGFKPTFYMVEDGHVVDDNLAKVNEYDTEYKFFPSLYKNKIKKTDNTYFFAADLGFYRGDHSSFEQPRFSFDFSKVAYCGQSVTYLNMQLAYYLGFAEVYLIGMDFSYQIRQTDEVRGQTLISNEDDINHFHPDYFGKGKKWHDPKVHNVSKNYQYAKEKFEKDKRKILNATVGGKLELFDRVDYNELF